MAAQHSSFREFHSLYSLMGDIAMCRDMLIGRIPF